MKVSNLARLIILLKLLLVILDLIFLLDRLVDCLDCFLKWFVILLRRYLLACVAMHSEGILGFESL